VRLEGCCRGPWACVLACVALLGFAQQAAADEKQPRIRMGIFTSKDARIDMTLPFTDADGVQLPLSRLVIPDKPFILVPIFYKCPRLCSLTFGGVIELINALPLTLGIDYSVVSYSFNPQEGPNDAREKRTEVVRRLKKQPAPPSGWAFVTGSPGSISALNDQLGFRIRLADKEIEHSSAIFVVSPDGTVRRYFAGIEFNVEKVQRTLQ